MPVAAMDASSNKGYSQDQAVLLVAQAGFFLMAVIWLIIGANAFYNLRVEGINNLAIWVILAPMMFANAIAFLFVGFTIRKRHKRFYYLALAVLVINIILSIADEFGIFDLITLLIDIGLLALLLIKRSIFVPVTHDSSTISG